MTLEPPPVTLQPPRVTLQLPRVTLQPPPVTLNHRRLPSNRRRLPSNQAIHGRQHFFPFFFFLPLGTALLLFESAMFSAALCSAMRRAACQGPRACAAPLLLPPSRRLRRALHTAGVLPAPIMADKREQERKALEQAQTVRAAMEEEERLRHERWRKWTPVEDAQYCTRKPSPLVAQPKGAKTLECTLAGFPSAGKSTLLCALVGHKVSATSRKPNTTQQPVVGVLTRHKTQVPRRGRRGLGTGGRGGGVRLPAVACQPSAAKRRWLAQAVGFAGQRLSGWLLSSAIPRQPSGTPSFICRGRLTAVR